MQLSIIEGVNENNILLGKVRRDKDREMDPYILYMENADRMLALRFWYPQVYYSLKEYYPEALKRPDDYPKSIQNAINEFMELRIPPGDYFDLRIM